MKCLAFGESKKWDRAAFGIGFEGGQCDVALWRRRHTDEHVLCGLTSGVDYSESATTITIPAGSTAGSITLTGLNDFTFVGNESLVVDIDSVTGGSENNTQQVTATISDDDSAPSVQFQLASSSANEAAGNVTVVVTLSAPSAMATSVPFTLGGTATNADRTVSGSPLVIAAGQTSAAIVVSVVNDSLDELNESVVLQLGTPTYVTGSSPLIVDAGLALSDIENNRLVRAEVTITDVESGDVLSLSSPVAGFTSTFASNVLTITANAGSGNLAAFRSALSRVQFSTTTIGDGNRSVSFIVTDTSGLTGIAGATSAPAVRALTVQSPQVRSTRPPRTSR